MAVLVCFLVLKSQEELFWIEVKVLNCLDFFGVFTCGKDSLQRFRSLEVSNAEKIYDPGADYNQLVGSKSNRCSVVINHWSSFSLC